MAPRTLGLLGISKVMTLTSTYDHRIIQGAESGLFLARMEDLLKGEDGFYDRVFADLGLPHRPVKWEMDANPGLFGDPRRARGGGEADEGPAAHPQLPGARAPRGRPRPARPRPRAAPRPRPRDLRAHAVGPRPRVPDRRALRRGQGDAARDPRHPARDLLRDDRRRVHVHRRPRAQGLAAAPHGVDPQLPGPRRGEQEAGPREDRGGGELRALPPHEVRGPQALLARGRGGAHPAARPHPQRRGAARAARGRDRHVAPRAAQRPRHHGRQAPLPDLRGVRGQRPRVLPGLGRREVPPRRDRHPPRRHGRDDHRHRGPEPEPPRVREPGGRGHGARQAGRDRGPRARAGPARPPPRGRRLRRPGGRGRDDAPLGAPRLPHGRHDPRGGEQPDRLHDPPRGRAQLHLRDRRREDGPRPRLPRERRRPRGGRLRGRPRPRVPAEVPQGRRDRHGLLPALGPQRDRRAELHPAAHVREDQDPPLGRDALRREAGARGRRHPRGARAGLGREEGRDAVGEGGRRDALRRDRAARAGRAGSGRRVGDVGTAQDGPEGARDAAGRPRDPPEARALREEARGDPRREGRRGLGDRGVARLGDAPPRGSPGAPLRAGLRPRHLLAAPRRPPRRADAEGVRAPERGRPLGRPLRGLRLAALRGRRDGLRVRLLGGRAPHARAVGGAVRRLHERRAGHHRPVPLGLGDEVGPAERARPAAAARARGAGAGALERAHRALPHALGRRRQPARRLPLDARLVLPPAAPAGPGPRREAAGRLHPEEPAAPPALRLVARRSWPRAASSR